MNQKSTPATVLKKIKLSWQIALGKLAEFGGISADNRVEIFHEGDDAFAAIHQDFSSAKETIFVEIFILASDDVGVWLRDALIEAAQRGVKVVVLYDHMGSVALTRAFLKPMIDAHIKVIAFNPIWPWRRRGPLLFRNHRKIIVIDERIAFCGSMNISVDYAGLKYGNGHYRDTLARIRGPAVKDLHRITLESIVESEFVETGQDLSCIFASNMSKVSFRRWFKSFFNTKNLSGHGQNFKDSLVQVLRSNTRRNLTHIQKSMELSINRAVSYCYFTTPYFLPYGDLRRAMIKAQKRGVDVRILTSGLSDVPLMRQASQHVYGQFLAAGVRIYEMNQKSLHAKLATIDGVYSSIGSYNLDHWSARRNLEVNLSIINREIASNLRQQFEKDLELCVEIKSTDFLGRSVFKKILSWLAYQLFRI